MNRRIENILWLAFLLGAAGLIPGCAHHEVRPDDMSAEAHRKEAERVYTQAEHERRLYDPAARVEVARTPTYALDESALTAHNPTQYHLSRAAQLAEHARQHLAAANELEHFEEGECRLVDAKVRAACPVLGPIAAVTPIADGVRLELAGGAPIDAVLAQMRCHLAYARTRGYQKVTECLLYVKGAEIRRSADGAAIEVVAHDRELLDELQKRAQELLGPPSI